MTVIDLLLFLAVPLVSMQYMVVLFTDHTLLLYCLKYMCYIYNEAGNTQLI